MTHLIITPEQIKRTIKIPDTKDDEVIGRVARTATDVIGEKYRVFQPFTATRTFTAKDADCLLLKTDVLSVVTLETDDGTRTYPYDWTADEYELGPDGVQYRNPPHPFWKLERISYTARYCFPVGLQRGVRAKLRCGFYDVRQASGVTLTAAVSTTTETGLTVSSVSPFDVGNTIKIDNEDMEITAIGTGLTVARGANGTDAATHTSGRPIEIYRYPLATDAALILAERYLRRSQDAPMGIAGNIEGAMRVAINDPFVVEILGSLKYTGV